MEDELAAWRMEGRRLTAAIKAAKTAAPVRTLRVKVPLSRLSVFEKSDRKLLCRGRRVKMPRARARPAMCSYCGFARAAHLRSIRMITVAITDPSRLSPVG